jgi:hypothetical protein
MRHRQSVEHKPHAFFIPDFRFSDRIHGAFKKHGVAKNVVAGLEEVVADQKGLDESGLIPNRRQQHARLVALHDVFAGCEEELAATDNDTLNVLNAAVLPRSGISLRDLCEAIAEYRSAARKAADHTFLATAHDATKDTAIAIAVGKTLKGFGIDLDATAKGKFVFSTSIVFEALDIYKSEPRNDVRRALKVIEKS